MADPAEHLPGGVRRAFERVEAALLGEDRPRVGRRRTAPQQAHRETILRTLRLLALGVSACMFVGFIFATSFYSSTRQRIEANPDVVNLTNAGFKAHVHFGLPANCEGSGLDCWVQPEFDDASWQTAMLPLSPNDTIKSLPEYDKGLAANRMYYRMLIPVPQTLIDGKDEIAFSPMYVQHERFEAFINGRLVYTSTNLAVGLVTTVSIPRADIKDGAVQITIRATVAPSDLGISHRTALLLGPKSQLDDLSIDAERSGGTYYLLFILSKGGIFVVFTFFFFYTRNQQGFVPFLLFAFFSTIENLFIGDFLSARLSENGVVIGFFLCKTTAFVGLLGFEVSFYRATALRRATLVAGALLWIAVAAMLIDCVWGTNTIDIGDLMLATNSSLVGIVAFGVILGVLTSRRWRRRKATGPQRDAIDRMTVFFAIYLVGIVWEFYFNDYGGYDRRPVLDLAFFICLALNTAIDKGEQEGKITTLEAHLEEKLRMELELQEAAEIAKAFLPQGTPSWPALGISILHRPLTENSGDWYAFEPSPNGRYFHFIMCDITGHGVQAAIVVSTARSVLSFYLHSQPEKLNEPDFILDYMRSLNATLWSNGAGYHVLTLLGVTFEPAAEMIHFVSAGHPSPIMVSPLEMRPKPLISRASVLGIQAEFASTMKHAPFKRGDELITYTDGLPLSSNANALRTFLATNAPGARTPEALFRKVWDSEHARTAQTLNDDVSIVWFTAA